MTDSSPKFAAVFGVSLIPFTYACGTIECSTPAQKSGGGYTNIYFGENQLSPGSLGILPLTTSHPMLLYQQRVRASFPPSWNFTLPMVSSLGFGSVTNCWRPVRTWFPCASATKWRRLAINGNSPVHSSIGTRSFTACAGTLSAC